MTAPMARFPRGSYAKRAARLAYDLAEWRASYLEFARGPDNWAANDFQIGKAESRVAALEDLVAELEDVAMRISAIR